MSSPSASSSRRSFLKETGQLAVAASVVAGTAAAAQAADDPKPRREVIPGSPSPAYSRAVRLDRLVFVAGCVGTYAKEGGTTIDQEFRAQARQTLKNLVSSVEAAGSSTDRVLKCNCFLKSYDDFKAFNDEYMAVFKKDPPARSTVIVRDFVVPGALLEVDCVCCVD